MKKFFDSAAFVFSLGLFGLFSMGVDLEGRRAGFGLFVAAVGMILCSFAYFTKRSHQPNLILSGLTIAGACYFLVRGFSGETVGLAVEDGVLVAIGLLSYLGLTNFERRHLSSVYWFVGLACVANLGVAYAQHSAETAFFVWHANPEEGSSISGFFRHYNYFAAFLNGAVFLFASYALLGKKPLFRALSLLLVLSCVSATLASGSRGGWIGLIVGSGVWLVASLLILRRTNSRAFAPTLIVGITVVVLGAVTAFGVIRDLSAQRSDRADAQVDSADLVVIDDGGRLGFQQLAFVMFLEEPLFGHGARSFSYLAWKHWDPEERSYWWADPRWAHNEYLQALADYGGIGFLSLLVILLAHYAYASIQETASSRGGDGNAIDSWLRLGAIGGLAALLMQSFFSFIFHVPALVALAGVLLALLNRRSGLQTPRSMIGSRFVGTLMLVFGIAGLYLGFTLSHSFLLKNEASAILDSSAKIPQRTAALQKLAESARLAYFAEGLERSGQLAMRFASQADARRDFDSAKAYREIALEHFTEALELNPYAARAVVGRPSVQDALGQFEEAELGHQRSMELLKPRERYLKSHYHAAKSAFVRGILSEQKGETAQARRMFHLARVRMAKRANLAPKVDRKGVGKELNNQIGAWVAFYEGEQLYRRGDEIWKTARPRDPAKALGLMLEARKRYLSSLKTVGTQIDRFEAQFDQLNTNIAILEGAQVSPAKIGQGELEEIINSEPSLAPKEDNR